MKERKEVKRNEKKEKRKIEKDDQERGKQENEITKEIRNEKYDNKREKVTKRDKCNK